MLFCEALGDLRLKVGIQPAILAEETGISPVRYKDIERGLVDPTRTEVLALCYVLKTTPEKLHYKTKSNTKAKSSNREEVKAVPDQENCAETMNNDNKTKKAKNDKKEDNTTKTVPKAKQKQPQKPAYTEEQLAEMRKDVGKKIRALRESKKITYAKISKELGIPSYQFVLIEEGKADIPENIKEKLLKLLQG